MSSHNILPAGAVLPPMSEPAAAATGVEGLAAPPTASDGGLERAGTVASASAGPAAPPAKPQPRGRRARPGSDLRHPDRFQVLNDFVDRSMHHVSDRAAKAWFVLYRDTKPDGLARTGLSDMATRMGCSVSTAKRAVRELMTRRLVTLLQKGAPGRGPNVYRVRGKPVTDIRCGGDEPAPSRP